MTRSVWVPGRTRLRYVGTIASRSTIPKKLKAYRAGLLTQARRRMYSMLKTTVQVHSATRKTLPYACRIEATLSSSTTKTLNRMLTSTAMSKALPAGVSFSKTMSWRRSRQWRFTVFRDCIETDRITCAGTGCRGLPDRPFDAERADSRLRDRDVRG